MSSLSPTLAHMQSLIRSPDPLSMLDHFDLDFSSPGPFFPRPPSLLLENRMLLLPERTYDLEKAMINSI